MKVMDKDGNVIDEWTSEKDKPHVIKRLVVGETYTLHEEFAPYGYLKATDVTFTVKDTAEVQKVEMKDDVPKALLIVNKKGEFLDKITLLDNMIAENNASIANLEEEIDKDYEIFRQRARASYMSGDSSTISLLLGADSFSDFLMKADITARVAENDREIIAGLEANIAELEKLQEENEANKADLNESKGTLDEKKQQLNGQVSQIQGQIEDIDALQKQYEANKAEIDKMMAQVQSEINDIYASYESQGEYTGGAMTWPVPGYTGITSYYGWRFNNTDFHTGIDISGSNIYGQNIVAAADGVVIKAQETYVQGVGYGRYLIIDHGGNISTLYGHTSQLLVSEGDHVTRGQAIAKVGSTGWSTGPHLHFEVRENGTAVNPLSGYLKP